MSWRRVSDGRYRAEDGHAIAREGGEWKAYRPDGTPLPSIGGGPARPYATRRAAEAAVERARKR